MGMQQTQNSGGGSPVTGGASPITKIFICSPYKVTSVHPGDMERERADNAERVRLACRLLAKLGYMPLAPHGYFTGFLDDSLPEERAEGMTLGLEWLAESDEVWVFGERISDGMSHEIALARELGLPVRCMPEPGQLIKDLLEAMKNNKKEEDWDHGKE